MAYLLGHTADFHHTSSRRPKYRLASIEKKWLRATSQA
ncbi:hypothetical protein FRUB_08983 [Fimbriiglobus ruber]|uniref:Uncharacterized protein n=1 Tax=Fimbriiglobus ruber TaxID=1908690 RepID=A0A225D4B0_9BACT|nr:hypothetical protein FRUB_08983 [Fimbriiglobus ruber]